MVTDKGKKSKAVADRGEEEDTDHIDGELVLSIEKLQEIQDELGKIYRGLMISVLGLGIAFRYCMFYILVQVFDELTRFARIWILFLLFWLSFIYK